MTAAEFRGQRSSGTPYLTPPRSSGDSRGVPGTAEFGDTIPNSAGVPGTRSSGEFRGHHTWGVPGTPYLTPKISGSSGDTIPNSENLSIVSPELILVLKQTHPSSQCFH